MRPHYPIALAWLRSALAIVLLGMTCTTATAETKQLWTGNATFDDWGDVVNISAQQMAGVSADDIVRFVIEAGEWAQLQVSYGTGWTCLDGLEACNVSGDYELVVTAQVAKVLKQGIHIKGVGYTLKAVEWIACDGGFDSQHPALTWQNLTVSGGTKGVRSTVGLHRYGAVGWYLTEPLAADMYEALELTFGMPLKADVIAVYTHGNGQRRRSVVKAGKTTCRLGIGTARGEVGSIALMSAEAQTIVLQQATLHAKDNAIEHTTMPQSAAKVYDMQGRCQKEMLKGVNIIVTPRRTAKQRQSRESTDKNQYTQRYETKTAGYNLPAECHGGHGRHSYRHGTSRHAGQRGRTQTICLPQR